MCLGSLLLPRLVSARRHHPPGLRDFGTGRRRGRACGVVRDAVGRAGLHPFRGPRRGGRSGARGCRRGLPAAADALDGRDAPGDRALGRDQPARGSRGSASSTAANIAGAVIGCLLGRLLPAARLRHGGGDICRRRHQRGRGRDRLGAVDGPRRSDDDGPSRSREPVEIVRRRWSRASGDRAFRDVRPWAPRWSGPACSRCCSAGPCTRSR